MKKVFESIMEATRVFFGGQPDCGCLSAEAYNMLIKTPQHKLPVELLPFISGANIKVNTTGKLLSDHVSDDFTRITVEGQEWTIICTLPLLLKEYIYSYRYEPLMMELRTLRDYGHTRNFAIIHLKKKVSS